MASWTVFLPGEMLYEAIIVLLPFLSVTAGLPIVLARAILRSSRGDRIAVAIITAVPLAWLWLAAVLWLFENADRAFP